MSALSGINEISFYGSEDLDSRIPVLSFNIEAKESGSIEKELDGDFNIIVRAGLHCSPDSHRSAGTYPNGTVRISPSFFNTIKEIDLTIEAIRKIAKTR